jgi:hypothetical protein
VKGEDGKRTESLIRRVVREMKRDVAVFIFFLLLSFILWYLNSLGKENEAGIKYCIKFTNLPKERIIYKEQPNELNIYLKGPGYSILELKLSGKKAPLIIDLSKVSYKRIPGGNALDYYIVSSGLAKSLNVQMRSGCEITSIKPDTLFFSFNKQIVYSTLMPDNKSDSNKKNGL